MKGAAHASQYLNYGKLGLPYHCDTGGPGQAAELGQEETPSVEDEDFTVRRKGLNENQEQTTTHSSDFSVDLRLIGRVVRPISVVTSLPTINPPCPRPPQGIRSLGCHCLALPSLA